jgi:anti-sigma factor RsiW
MNCAKANQMLDAWLDGELDSETSGQMLNHVPGCPECTARKQSRENLKEVLSAASLRFPAPTSLQNAVRRDLHVQRKNNEQPKSIRLGWRDLLMVSGSSLATAMVMIMFLGLPPRTATFDQAIVDVLAQHSASLVSQKLFEVASSDRHVIKPWLQTKVNFAPPVPDLSTHGISLLGARLDRIDAQTAVALVYKLRNHPINIFVWPAKLDGRVDLGYRKMRGFAVGAWSADGLNYVAISDLNLADLQWVSQRYVGGSE